MPNKTELLKNHRGLNFHLLNPAFDKSTILNKALADRGVKDVDRFSDPQSGRDYRPSQAHRQPLAKRLVNYVSRLLKPGQMETHKPKNIYILVDNDADGFTSAAFMYKYLKAAFSVEAKFVFTPGKNHGIKAANVKSKISILKNIGLLVIPDASLGVRDLQFLSQWKIPYLIIDHHDINHQRSDLAHKVHIFNNQWDDTKINRQFTGVGMVYLFCKLLDQRFKLDYADKFMYLLSIGQVGDVSDISDPEIRHYVITGFRQMIKSKLLKLTVATDRVSAHELSFSIIPKINAVCRTGSLDDKRDLLNALVDNEPDGLVTIKFRRKSHIDHKFHQHHKKVDHYYLEAKQLNRIKSRQKRAVKKSLRALDNIFETKSFIIALDKSGNFYQEEAGLIATQISHKYQKPAIVMRTCKRPNYYKGSARGNSKVMKDFRRFCNQTQKFVYALGHPNAFGIEISKDQLKDLLAEYKNVDLSSDDVTYNVDNLYIDSVPSKREIVEFDDRRDLFGGKVKEPVLGFAGLKVKPSNIRFFGSVLNFKAHGLNFILFSSSDQLQEKMFKHHGDYYFDVVGSPDINRFMKYHYPQVIVSNLKITSPIDEDTAGDDFEDFYF